MLGLTRTLVTFTESVQTSLERKFGNIGGRIPITPTAAFEERIAVSITNPRTSVLGASVSPFFFVAYFLEMKSKLCNHWVTDKK